MGYLDIELNRDEKNDRVYIFPKDVSDISQVIHIVYDRTRNGPPYIHLSIKAQKNVIVLRKEVVDENYGGIEKLIKDIKSGNINLDNLRLSKPGLKK